MDWCESIYQEFYIQNLYSHSADKSTMHCLCYCLGSVMKISQHFKEMNHFM